MKNAAWRASVSHIPERVTLDTAINAGQHGMEHFRRVAMACSNAESEMIDELRDAIAAGTDRDGIFGVMAAQATTSSLVAAATM